MLNQSHSLSLCPALAMCLSVLLHHRHEAALSVWMLQLILCRFCQAQLRLQCSPTRKAWNSGELWFEILWEAEGLSWNAGAREVCLDLPKHQYLPDCCCSPSNKAQMSEVSAFSKVFPQSSDLNSISAALKELNTWTETQIVPVLRAEKEICFIQATSMFFFPLKLNFSAASVSGNCSPFVTSWSPLYLLARSASPW